MDHAVARFTQPCQIRNFVDSFDWKFIIYVMTMLGYGFRKDFAAAFTFPLIPIVGVLTVHKILKIVLSFGIYRQRNVCWGVDGWAVTW